VLRVLEAVEKVRKMLSSVPDAALNVDYLAEEEDLVRTVKKDEFEQLIDPYLRRFSDLIKATIAASGLSTDQIHSVELVGDATRTPIVMDIIKQLFNKPTLERTLNSLETVARGAALQSAILSPNFQVADFITEEHNALPVQMQYQFQGADAKMNEIFGVGTMFPLTKNVTFDNKNGNLSIMLKYAENAQVLSGLPMEIAQY
jgi:heat shock protein 4